MECPNPDCRVTDNAPDAKYCHMCGKRLKMDGKKVFYQIFFVALTIAVVILLFKVFSSSNTVDAPVKKEPMTTESVAPLVKTTVDAPKEKEPMSTQNEHYKEIYNNNSQKKEKTKQIEQVPQTYSLNVESNNPALGTVSGTGRYKAGEIVSLNATDFSSETSKVRFIRWEINGAGQSNNQQYDFTMPANDISIKGIFELFYVKGKRIDNGVYTGYLVNGKMEGKGGSYQFDSGNRYEGDFVNGKFNGKGIYYSNEGWKYDGYFKNGMMHGEGIHYPATGKPKKGIWENDKLIKLL